jgi:hypothetical protein
MGHMALALAGRLLFQLTELDLGPKAIGCEATGIVRCESKADDERHTSVYNEIDNLSATVIVSVQ